MEKSFFKSIVSNLATGPLGVMLLQLRASAIEPTRVKLTIAGRSRTSTVAEIFVAQAVDAVGIGAVALLLASVIPNASPALAVAFGIGGALMGWVLPSTALDSAAQNRQQAIMKALPFAIDLLVSAIRSGLDFGAAVRYYVNLGHKGPLTEEFATMLRENELGTGRVTALQNMADRIRIKSFTAFVSAIALGTEMGSPLSDTMEIQGEELRKTRFALAENKAQKAPSKMILPMALFIMPAVFVIIFTPIYIRIRSVKTS